MSIKNLSTERMIIHNSFYMHGALATCIALCHIKYLLLTQWVSQVAQMVKCLPALRETRVRSLAQENALEKEMVTHSRTLAWKIPWMEEPGRLSSSVLKFLYSPTLTSIHDYWKNHSLDPCQQSNVSVF